MIKIKPVETKAELDEAHAIRKEVFVVEQQCPEDIELEFEEEAKHYVALNEENFVGTSRGRYTENGIKMERFAVLKSQRGLQVGASLLHAMLNDTRSLGKKIYLHAQLHAAPFYAKYGFKPEGEHFWEADIEHVKMVFKPTE